MESRESSIQVKLHDRWTSKKVAMAIEQHLNLSHYAYCTSYNSNTMLEFLMGWDLTNLLPLNNSYFFHFIICCSVFGCTTTSKLSFKLSIGYWIIWNLLILIRLPRSYIEHRQWIENKIVMSRNMLEMSYYSE